MSAELPRLRRRFGGTFPSQRSDVNRCGSLGGFTARDREDPPPVGGRRATIRLGYVEASALRGPQCLIPESRILDSRPQHRNQKVAGNSVRNQLFVRK